jgi:hypothetical protein
MHLGSCDISIFSINIDISKISMVDIRFFAYRKYRKLQLNNLISDYSAIIVFSNYCFHRCMKFRQHAYGGNCEFMIQVCGQLKLKAKTEKL